MERIRADQAHTLLGKAKDLLLKDAPEEAVQASKEALSLLQQLKKEDETKEDALNVLVSAHLAKGDTSSAVAAAKEAAALYRNSKEEQAQAAALQTLSKVLTDLNSPEAPKVATELAELRQSQGDVPGQAAALQLLVAAHGKSAARGEVAGALKSWLATVRGLKDKPGEAAVLQTLIRFHIQQQDAGVQDLREASQLSEQATVIYKELDDKKGQSELLSMFVRVHLAKEDLDEALIKAKAMVQLHRGGDPDDLVGALLLKASVYQRLEDFPRATRSANQALVSARDAKHKRAEIDALYGLVKVHFAMGKGDEAVERALEAKDLCKRFEDKGVAAGCVALLARAMLDMNRPQQALDVAEEARLLYGQVDHAQGQAELFRGVVAEAQLANEEREKALATTEAALELFRILGDRTEELKTMLVLAQRRKDVGSGEDALQAALELVALCERSGKRASEGDARLLVADLHYLIGEHQEALRYCNSALELFQNLKDEKMQVTVLDALARVCVATGEFDTAQGHATEARGICLRIKDGARAAQMVATLVNIRLHRQEFAEVVKAAKSGKEQCRKEGDMHGEAQQWMAIAGARLEQVRAACPFTPLVPESEMAALPTRRLMEAFMAAKEALYLFQRLGESSGEAFALQAQAKAHRFKRQPLLALEAAKNSAALFKAVGDKHSAAQSLLLEATTQLLIAGTPWEEEDAQDAAQRPKPLKQALAAAQEACDLCKFFKDQELEEYANQVLEAARESVKAPVAVLPKKEERFVAVDRHELGLLQDMGFKFKSLAQTARLLQPDVRLEALLPQGLPQLALLPHSAGSDNLGRPDPAMDRLMAAARRAQTSR